MWQKLAGKPLGKRAFGLGYGWRVPYFRSIRPRFTEVRPGFGELVIRKRRAVLNHIGTVHAIAVCNGLEAAMGAMAEATVPDSKRWLPKGMDIAYTAKSTSDITCTAESDPERWLEDDPDVPVAVTARRDDGTVVAQGTIRLWVTDKPAR
ncbi:DUF4442 domain-containing protein [Myceligenerans sp. I2]|uniref:DUF4442 domain-containing protein n=2 Tax=Myceligenerans indicum TaxID=2593663 RepID=A0ABS1LJ65_9MICO|nr:DUF4442 domain-containing protein [Myceligenerans indicum]